MTTINTAYINALLADACYVGGLSSEDDVSQLREKLTKRMTASLAEFIANNFTVVIQESGASGFDATVWRGRDGTAYAGEVYLSIRGTAGFEDLVTDIDLSTSGLAYAQLKDMINWWLRVTTPADDPNGAKQIDFSPILGADNSIIGYAVIEVAPRHLV